MKPEPRSLRPALWAYAGAIALLAVHAWYYRHFMVDDAFISLRYSDRFAHGLGLTWNDGEVVEGYSNLLWVLLCALLAKVGMNLVVAARVLGFLGTAAAMSAVLWVERGPTARHTFPGLAGAIAIAASGPIAIWTVGGLEQPLLACLLAWALALSFPLLEEARPRISSLLGPGLLLGLIAITRPDGAVFTVAAMVGVLTARGVHRDTLRTALLLAVLPAVFFAAQLASRLAYYHEWVPNSAFAKVAFTPQRISAGLQYVGGAIWLVGLLAPALFAFRLASEGPARRRAVFLGAILALWLSYLVFIGGDFFPGDRHLVPAVVVLAYLAALAFREWISKRRALAPAARAGALCFIVLAALQFLNPRNIVARDERWVWDGEPIGRLLADAFGRERPLLAVDPAGCVPYFSGLPSVDMLGINDRYLAHHRPKDFGKGTLGHELGSGAYVLSRKPDLVLFNLPTGNLRPYFRSGREMVFDSLSNFRETFQPVNFECDRPRHLVSIVWARLEGGAIGIRRSIDRIVVPGYLLSANPYSMARLDSEGRMGVQIQPDVPAGISGLRVPAGRWQLRALTSGGAVVLHAWSGDPAVSASGVDSLAFDVAEGAGDVTIGIEMLERGVAHLREVALRRIPPQRAE